MSIEIQNKIEQYGAAKEYEKSLKKQIASLSDEIKKYLKDNNLTSDNSNSYIVALQPKSTESVDEEAMLQILKEDWAKHNGSMQCPYIKTVEYLDMDEVEARAYKGEISKEVLLKLDKCRHINQTVVLVYKERKTK